MPDRSRVFFGLINKSEIFGRDDDSNTGRSLYLTKYNLRFLPRLKLHVFTRGDIDDDPHDHPWDFWTFPLVAYDELVGQTQIVSQTVECGKWHFRQAEHIHRVTGSTYAAKLAKFLDFENNEFFDRKFSDHWHVPWLTSLAWWLFGEGKIVTLVWLGKPRRSWGFYVRADKGFVWIPWQQYVDGTQSWIKP